MRWMALAIIGAALMVQGQEKGSQPAADQKPGQNPQAPQSNCSVVISPPAFCAATIDKQTAQSQQDGAPDHPKGYFSRLFSPENLPQIGLIFVGIGGIIVALWTLNHLHESSERQLRAYVMPESAGLYDGSTTIPLQPARNNIPGVLMLLKNSGQTPAYRVISWMGIDVIPVADEGRLTLPPVQEEFYLTLAGGTTFSKVVWFNRPLAANEIADIMTGVRAIYVHGRVEYRDAFKMARFTNFRLHYTSNQFPAAAGAGFNFSQKGNDADP